MDLLLYPGKLRGAVTPPPSKSESHRLILAAALAEGESRLRALALSDDLSATLRGAKALGARVEETAPGELSVRGCGAKRREEPMALDCGASGSTLRFMIPLALALCGGGDFSGEKRLLERPLQPYFMLFDEKGIDRRLSDGLQRVRTESVRPIPLRYN